MTARMESLLSEWANERRLCYFELTGVEGREVESQVGRLRREEGREQRCRVKEHCEGEQRQHQLLRSVERLLHLLRHTCVDS